MYGGIIADSAKYDDVYETEQKYLSETNLYRTFKLHPGMLYLYDEYDTDFQYWNYITSLSNIGKISSMENYFAQGNYDVVSSMLSDFDADNTQEENFASIMSIAINHALTDSLSSTDSISLLGIAYEHPLLGGNAVFSARNLLNLEIYDTTLVSSARLARSFSDSFVALNVFPNPAKQNIHIASNILLDNAMIIIHDVSGRVVMQTIYKNDINISSFEPGLYYIDLVTEDAHHYKTRFINAK